MNRIIGLLLAALLSQHVYAQSTIDLTLLDYRTHQHELTSYFLVSVAAYGFYSEGSTMFRFADATIEDVNGDLSSLDAVSSDAFYDYEISRKIFLKKPSVGADVKPARMQGKVNVVRLPDCDVIEFPHEEVSKYFYKNVLAKYSDIQLSPLHVEEMNALRSSNFNTFKAKIEEMVSGGIASVPPDRELDDLIRDVHGLLNDSYMANMVPFLITDPQFKVVAVQVFDDEGNLVSQTKREKNQLRVYLRKNPQPHWKVKVFVENKASVENVDFVVENFK